MSIHSSVFKNSHNNFFNVIFGSHVCMVKGLERSKVKKKDLQKLRLQSYKDGGRLRAAFSGKLPLQSTTVRTLYYIYSTV